MTVKDKIVESVASEATKIIIAPLLLLLSSLLVGLVPQIRDRVLPGLPKSLLVVIAGISLSLNLALVFYVLRLRQALNLNRKLTHRFGVLWSQDQVAHCPACRKPLGYYGEQVVRNWKRMGFKCLSCQQVVLMSNDEGKLLKLTEAKKLLTAKEQDASSEQPKEVTDNLDETSVKLLRILANSNREHNEQTLIQSISLHPERVRHYLNLLEEGKYIYAIHIPLGFESPTPYHLDRKGRDYLLQHNLI